MILVSKAEFSKDVKFPVIQPIPSIKPKGILNHLKSFIMFRREWIVTLPSVMWCESLRKFIYIPGNFVFDGASVPKILSGLYNSTGMLLYGAAPHDFGYRYKGLFIVNLSTRVVEFKDFTKSELDDIFCSLCKQESGLPLASWIAKKGLSMFGFLGWNQNRKKGLRAGNDYKEFFTTY